MNVDLLYPIRPIGVLPMPIPIFPFEFSLHILSFLGIVLVGLLAGFLINRYSKSKWGKSCTANIIFPMVALGLLFIANGISITLIQGFIFFMLLFYASLSDIYKREVPNWVSFSIAITGLIGANISDLPLMLFSAVIITIPQLLIAMSKDECYGGADIKIMAACAFVLGLEGSFAAIIIGLGIGLLSTVIKRKIKKDNSNEKFPIVPWLALGSFFVFIFL